MPYWKSVNGLQEKYINYHCITILAKTCCLVIYSIGMFHINFNKALHIPDKGHSVTKRLIIYNISALSNAPVPPHD